MLRRWGGGAQAAELGRRAQVVELRGGAQAAEPWRRGKQGWRRGRVSREKEIRRTHPRLEERGMDWFDQFCRLSRSHVFGEYSLCVDGSIPVYCNQTNAY
jgi:hypothetical protein